METAFKRQDLAQYVGQVVSVTFDPTLLVLSYVISLVGAASTLELIHRRTSRRGYYNKCVPVCVFALFLFLWLAADGVAASFCSAPPSPWEVSPSGVWYGLLGPGHSPQLLLTRSPPMTALHRQPCHDPVERRT